MKSWLLSTLFIALFIFNLDAMASSYELTYTLYNSQMDSVDMKFDGTDKGGIITGITNVRAMLDGIPINMNGYTLWDGGLYHSNVIALAQIGYEASSTSFTYFSENMNDYYPNHFTGYLDMRAGVGFASTPANYYGWIYGISFTGNGWDICSDYSGDICSAHGNVIGYKLAQVSAVPVPPSWFLMLTVLALAGWKLHHKQAYSNALLAA